MHLFVLKLIPLFSSNMTSGMKKQHSYLQQQLPGQDYPNTCYQLNGSNNNNNNPNSLNYPPPPSYGAPQGNPNGHNAAFQTSSGLFGYSRPASPNNYPHSGVCETSSISRLLFEESFFLVGSLSSSTLYD